MMKTTRPFAQLIAASVLLLGLAGPVQSASAVPQWSLTFPSENNTSIAPGADVSYFVTARNVGTSATGGGEANAYRLKLTMPAGVTVATIAPSGTGWSCSGTGTSIALCTRTNNLNINASAPRVAVVGTLDGTAEPGVLPPLQAEIAGGGSGANVPVMSDGVTACGFAGSVPTPFEPACATESSAPMLIDPEPLFGVRAFDGSVTANSLGDPFSQAGGHPYEIGTDIALNTDTDPLFGPTWPVEPLRNLSVDIPPGLIGNPIGTSRCTLDQLFPSLEGDVQAQLCPAESQVGVAVIVFASGSPTSPPNDILEAVPVYNMVPPPDAPARFAMSLNGTFVPLDFTLRSGSDYGLTLDVPEAVEGVAVISSRVRLWGYPADPSHNSERFCPNNSSPGCTSTADPTQPLLRLPTACTPQGVGLETTLFADSWFNPGARDSEGRPDLSDPDWKSASFTSHDPPGFPLLPNEWGPERGPEGCDQVPFDPSISAKPTTNQADSPTGLEFDLTMPQEDAAGIAPSDLEDAVVTLPAGMSVNPSSADGLGACSSAQIDLDSSAKASCPSNSKIGTLEIETPLLEDSLEGSVYLAKQGDNPFGSLLALYLYAEGPGLTVKLAGKVEADPDTGRLTTTFTDQPQLPFENLHLELKGGPRAPLITPRACGTHTVTASLTPWSGNATEQLSSSFEVIAGPGGAPCPNGAFDPQFTAGSQVPFAATYSPFSLRLSRSDGSAELSGLEATLPPGLSAKFAGIPYCPEAALASISGALGAAVRELASPSCPAASQIGRVVAGAGAGSNPFYVDTGKAYLAGPYKGAPLSVAIVTPALAGPFDLGNIVVRSALHVDPKTAQGRAVSDPLPRFLHGIALDLRDVRVELDRPGFTLNPTNCEEMSVRATISGVGGATAQRSSRFQVAECAVLGFKPKLSLRLKGATKRGAHPRLTATLQARGGDANIGRVQVALPRSAFLDQANIRTVCTRVQFAADACPKGSIYGRAVASTPLLDEPLKGPVYLRSSDNTLPDLVMALRGPDQRPIEIELAGRIDTLRGAIRTTFETVPDTPVSKFVLTMQGGKRKGLIVNSRDICAHRNRATVKMDGHNGKIRDFRPLLRNQCAKRGGAKRGGRSR